MTVATMESSRSVIPVTEVNLARVPRALEGEVRGGSSLEGAGKGRLWRKGSGNGQCSQQASLLGLFW